MKTSQKWSFCNFAVSHFSLTIMTIILIIGLISFSAGAIPYSVDVNTSVLSGSSAELAFDFIYGGGPTPNTITISNFITDGTLGTAGPNSGIVAGTLLGPVTLSTAGPSFFNEYLTGITLGTDFSFQLDATTNGPGSALPDGFSLFILDSTASSSIVNTSDPSGSNSLMLLSVDGTSQGALSTYTAPGGEVTVTAATASVPEPSTLVLFGIGVAITFWSRKNLFRNF